MSLARKYGGDMSDFNENLVIESIPSPCIRNCCLDEKDICLGCFRHLDEIIGWQERSNDEKKFILECCGSRRK